MIYNKKIKMEVFEMPKYKLSPEERAAEKERKENLRSIMQGLDVKNFDDLRDVFKLMGGEYWKTAWKASWTTNSGTASTIIATRKAKTAGTATRKRR